MSETAMKYLNTVTQVLTLAGLIYGFGQFYERFNNLEKRFDRFERKVEERFDKVEYRLTQIEIKLETKFETFDFRLKRIEK